MLEEARKQKILVTIIIIVMLVLAIANIGNRTMFIDESIEAMLGKNILEFGYPKAWDGKNLVLAEVNGNEFNHDLVYIRKNWISNYIAALGQAITNLFSMSIEASVIIMRTEFALIGVMSAYVFFLLCKEMTKKRRTQTIALVLYAFSVNILLYIRSIYYLAPTLLFVMLTILFYLRYIKDKKNKQLVGFSVSAIMLFHSFYPYFLITMITIFTVFMFFDFSKEMLKQRIIIKMAISLGTILFLTIPWYAYARTFLAQVEDSQFTSCGMFFESLLGYLWQIHSYFLPVIPIGLICLVVIVQQRFEYKGEGKETKPFFLNFNKKKDNYKYIFLAAIQIIINVVAISSVVNFLDTRRLLGAIPFLFFFLALMIDFLIERKRVIGYAILILCLCTNVLHVSPYLLLKNLKVDASTFEKVIKPPVPFFDVDVNWHNKRADLRGYLDISCRMESNIQYYLEEILNNYDDADEGIVKFLNMYATSSQNVMVIGYQYETIAYYTGCRVVNRLDTNKDPLPSVFIHYPNAERFETLTQCAIEECDWIIERRLDDEQSQVLYSSNPIWHDEAIFEKYYIDYPDAEPWNEIWAHSFVTDESYEGVYIYRNKLTTDSIELPGNKFTRER